MKKKVAIIGSGNIGTDLMIKIMRTSESLEVAALIGIDPQSDGLAMAGRLGVATTHDGIEGALALPEFGEARIVFDATSAKAHSHHDEVCRRLGKQMIDLTPAAVGPYVVPVVNMTEHFGTANLNMVSCGGQATIPMVAAVGRVADRVPYAEIVSSISSRSAGPGHPRQHRRVHRDHRAAGSRRSAAANAVRRSSSSTRPIRPSSCATRCSR